MFGICSNLSIIVFEALGRCNDERKIDPFKYGLGAFDAGAAKFSDIINTSGVDEDYGADGGEFTGFFHRVRCGAGNIRDNGNVLVRQCIGQ